MADLIDEEWARQKRHRRYTALKEDGAMFGLVPSEEVEFSRLKAEFETALQSQEPTP